MNRAISLIANKWTVPIIYHLQQANGPVRFRQLQRMIQTISQKELTKRLRELERSGVIHRKVYPEVPPRVEYRLSEIGRTLDTPLAALAKWAERYGPVIEANRRREESPAAQSGA